MTGVGCNHPAVTVTGLSILGQAAAGEATRPVTVGGIVLIIGGALMGGGFIFALGGVGHRLDDYPRWKRPSLVIGLSMFAVGAAMLLVGFLTK